MENLREAGAKATFYGRREGGRLMRMGPGSGFPKNEDGTSLTQAEFASFLGQMIQLGYPLVFLTAGIIPEEGLILYEDDSEAEALRSAAKANQCVDDFVRSIADLVESGSIQFSD